MTGDATQNGAAPEENTTRPERPETTRPETSDTPRPRRRSRSGRQQGTQQEPHADRPADGAAESSESAGTPEKALRQPENGVDPHALRQADRATSPENAPRPGNAARKSDPATRPEHASRQDSAARTKERAPRAESASRQADPATRPENASRQGSAARTGDRASAQDNSSRPAAGSRSQERSQKSGDKSARQTEKASRRQDRAPRTLDRTFHPLERTPRSAEESRRTDRTGNSSPKAAAKSSAKSDRNRSAAGPGSRRTWHDFLVQLAAVILGVAVTFVGLGQIVRWQEARRVKVMMRMVYDELKTNRADVYEVCRSLNLDRRGMVLLREHGLDYRAVPADSLRRYRFIQGGMSGFAPEDDALEVLRASGAVMSDGDRRLLYDVLGCYGWLESFSKRIADYNARKTLSLDRLVATGTSGAVGGSDPVESWRVVMNDPMCAAFVGTMSEWFGQELLEGGAVARIDRVLAALEEKYGFE